MRIRRFISKKSGIYEALIADMLMKSGHEELYFYKNNSSRTEIEYKLPSSAGVVPVEVKTGSNRSKSPDRILEHEVISHGYKLIDGNTGVSGRKITMPLYMTMLYISRRLILHSRVILPPQEKKDQYKGKIAAVHSQIDHDGDGVDGRTDILESAAACIETGKWNI